MLENDFGGWIILSKHMSWKSTSSVNYKISRWPLTKIKALLEFCSLKAEYLVVFWMWNIYGQGSLFEFLHTHSSGLVALCCCANCRGLMISLSLYLRPHQSKWYIMILHTCLCRSLLVMQIVAHFPRRVERNARVRSQWWLTIRKCRPWSKKQVFGSCPATSMDRIQNKHKHW